ncbi:ABC transporter ATP-binding protein [Facklamia hominis]|uniref:ABC transporter ATP-binding protein n=1 Tax=Facklamia hominis TaxID=178214 RepID=A0AAJ1V213_9LACT|nr:ABC transporter ATP-binding protein [Facklamia hominis]MDK7186633.1 ABC transporter ATP-binding protein [Facklamia hominis]
MIKWVKQWTMRDYIDSVIAIALIVLQVYLDLKMPDYMSQITVLVQSEGSQLSQIVENGAWMLACALGSMLSAMVTGYLVSLVSARFARETGRQLFDQVTRFSQEELHRFSTASLITRNTNDITQVQQFLAMGFQMLVKAPITAVWVVQKILNKSWQWSAATGIAVLVLLTGVSLIMWVVVPRFKLIQEAIDQLNRLMREHLTGMRVIRAFNAESYQEAKFDQVNDELTKLQTFNQKMFAFMSPMMYLVMNGLALIIYWMGAHLIDQAAMVDKISLFGNMIVFSSYAMQVIMSFLMLAFIFMMVPRAQVSMNRINEVLETPIKIKDGSQTIGLPRQAGKVEFKQVSFAYPDAKDPVLEDISFTALPGQTVAFIGATGSGKSTLIHLIPRFYDVTSGSVLVDGIDVRDYRLEDLYHKLGYVPQKTVLFNDRIDANIRFGQSQKLIDDDQVKRALSIAQASDFVAAMDDQEASVLSQGANNISGGQKQRLSIARAIAKDPEIFIFDDSFSALDYKTDANLRKELEEATGDSTKLIVAQRIGTIMHADLIIVLDQGKIVGQGKHQELLQTCPVYREIALSQLSEEELNHG